MLCERFDADFLAGILKPMAERRPFPPARERDAWDTLGASGLNARRKAFLIESAEALLGQPWPVLPATGYLDFIRTGNRARYERPHFARRNNLGRLVLAECFEGQGRFIDEIINGIWSICEESTWTLPAHVERRETGDWIDLLPDPDKETPALFSCETAAVLAEACYLLADELDAVSSVIRERVRTEVDRRIITPVETRDDCMWMDGRNNWTPWCASNIMGAALLLMDDDARLVALSRRLMLFTDRFIGSYEPDGGCDEGPGYWNAAAGAMLRFLEHLRVLYGPNVDIYDDPKIRAMGQYITNAHLDGPWFTNFADGPPKTGIIVPVVYRYGERIGDPAMMNLALVSMCRYDPAGPVEPVLRQGHCGGDLLYMAREMWWIPADAEPNAEVMRKDVWLPDLQLMVARESETPGSGLVLAAKGGHNFENHNHNDVGHFVILKDGRPVIADAGVATYTKQTFRHETRWDLWYIRASGHNMPVINGFEQQYGEEYTARDVQYVKDGIARMLQLDMAPAYPAEAHLEQAFRTILFDPAKKSINVTDYVDTGVGSAPVKLELNLLSPLRSAVTNPGTVRLGGLMRLGYDPALFTADVSELALEDERLRAGWGDALYRITLRGTAPEHDCAYALTFVTEE